MVKESGVVVRGWSVFKQIFADHWDNFKRLNPRYDTEYYDELVCKMLSCGNPENIGYVKYMCLNCGHGIRLISMSCKSSLCLRCSKVYVDNWVSQVSKMLHPGLFYRHIVLTVPESLRKFFFNNSSDLLSHLMRVGVNCLDDFFSHVAKKTVKGGYIVVLQTHGRDGQYNPHLHIIATSGGIEDAAGAGESKWHHLDYLPYTALHKKWQWYLLKMLREEVNSAEVSSLINACYKEYPKGFIVNVQKGDVPNRYKSLAKYLARYVVSPPISIRRIDNYDEERGYVTYHYRSHRSGNVEKLTLDVYRFIGRMIQHVFPKGFKRVRYYGVQATKTFKKFSLIILSALSNLKSASKLSKLSSSIIQIISKKNYRERYRDSCGVDPLKCPYCGAEMEIVKIWEPIRGVIFDEFDEAKRGIRIRGGEDEGTEGKERRRTLWPETDGIQLSLFDMRGRAYG